MKNPKVGDKVKVKVWVGGDTDADSETFITEVVGLRGVNCIVDVTNSRLIRAAPGYLDQWTISNSKCLPRQAWGYIVEEINPYAKGDRYAKIEDGMTGGPSGLKWL